MKKSLVPVIVFVAIVLVIIMMFSGTYNGLVLMREEVRSQYSTMYVQLQRRADLIPNLVRTVQGYNVHEKEIIDYVVEARAKLAGTSTSDERIAAEAEMSGALSRFGYLFFASYEVKGRSEE